MAAPPFEINLAEVSTLDERQEFVSMVGVQAMVRATCLQVMGAPPGQLAEYRREVLELHALIQGFRQDVAELKQQQRQQQAFPPSSPSILSAIGSESEETTLANDTVLRLTWEEHPTRSWYEGRPLPRFSVRLDAENGGGPAPDGIRLRACLLNGRGGVEETRANGSSALVAGERYAYVGGGRAEWERLVVSEASSKHYGGFTILIDAVKAPPHVRVRELRSEPMQVQVGRMWSKRRKADDEISPSDSINQIPGVGSRYVARLQLQGISSIGQFSAMAATPEGRATLCRLCKGDNPRNSLNDLKLQAMIDKADSVVRQAHGAEALKRQRYAAQAGGGAQANPNLRLPPLAQAQVLPHEHAQHGAHEDALALPWAHEQARFDLDELLLLAEAPEVAGGPVGMQAAHGVRAPAPTAVSHDAVGGAAAVDGGAAGVRSLRVAHGVPLHAQSWGGGGVHGGVGGGVGGGVNGGVGGYSPPPIYRSGSMRPEGGALGILPPSPGKACGMAAFDALEEQMGQLSAKDQPSMAKLHAHAAPPAHAAAALAMRAAWRGDAVDALPTGPELSGCRERAFGCSALHLAALGGHVATVGALRAGGAPLSPARGLGRASPLHAAAALGAAGEAAALALLASADATAVEAVCGAGITALHLAAWTGSLALLEALLQAKAEPSRCSDSGLRALEFAALGGHTPCVEALLRWLPPLAASEGVTLPALHCAALQGTECVALLLAAAPAQLHMRGGGGVLPTHCAAASANEAGLRALLAAGGDAGALDEAGLSALHLACAGGHAECVSELVAAGADINGSSAAFPWTPLHCATAFARGEGGLESIRVLLSAGADRALAPAAVGRSPLELAQLLGEGEERDAYSHARAVLALLEP